MFGIVFCTVLSGFATSGCRPSGVASEAKAEPPPVAVSVVKASLRDISETVAAQGTLTPVQGGSAHVSAPIAGRLQSVFVREGDSVTQGQVVALLDTRSQQAQVLSAAATFRASSATAKQLEISAAAAASDQTLGARVARLALATALADRDAATQNARTALDLARTDLAKTVAGARTEEIVQARDALKQAEATRMRAETEAKRQQFLFEKGVSARRLVDDATTALAVAESAAESAGQNLALVKAGARTEDRSAARLRVQQAEESLRQSQVSGAARIAQASAVVRQSAQSVLQVAAKGQEAQAARDNVAKAAADVSAAQVQAGYSTIRAPLSGTVTRRNLNPGDIADTVTPVIEIVDTKSLDLVANLAASDGERVRAGMRAQVVLTDVPKVTPVEARVLSVGVIDPLTNLLSVRVRVPNGRGIVKSGAFATAQIVVRTARQVVCVPQETLLTRGGKSVIFVVTNGAAKSVPVTVGIEQDGQVFVTGAVRAGDTVIRLGQYELEDGAMVTVASP